MTTNSVKGSTLHTVTSVARGAQIILAVLILSLSASLATRWSDLENACGPGPYDKECSKIAVGLGGLRYCIFVGVWGLVDVGVWIINSCVTEIPWYLVILCGQFMGGFALGGGCTLASLINGWSCVSGADGSLRLCHQFYADLSFLFVMVVASWTNVICLWHLRKCSLRPDPRLS